MYDVMIRYEDGKRSRVEAQIDDLGEACAYVLRLADRLSDAPHDGLDEPKWVEIFREDRLEISVSVVRGGLTGRRGARAARSA